MKTFTLEELMACAGREGKMREYVYPKLVREQKMTPQKAAREIELMTAIFRVLHQCARMRDGVNTSQKARREWEKRLQDSVAEQDRVEELRQPELFH